MNLPSIRQKNTAYLYFLVLCPSPSIFPNELNYLLQFTVLSAIIAHSVAFSKKTHSVILAGYILLCCIFFIAMGANESAIGISLATSLRESLKLLTFPILLIFIQPSDQLAKYEIKKHLAILTTIQFLLIVATSTEYGASAVSLLYDTRKLSAGTAISEKIRYLGSFENPNYLAFFFAIAYAYIAINSKKRIQFLSFSIYFILIFLTGSRTGTIAILACASVIHYKTAITLTAPILLLYSENISSRLPTRFQEITSIAKAVESHSLSVRLEILKDSIRLIQERPFIGHFESPFDITDNWYILIALRYGLIPCAAAATLAFLIFFKRFRFSFISRKGLAIASTPIIFSLTGAFLDNPRIYGIAAIVFISSIKTPFLAKDHYDKNQRY